MNKSYKNKASKVTNPTVALEMLKEGNERFLNHEMYHRDHQWHIKETLDSQHPFAIILGCIDSRVEPSIIFDQGIGDLFIARVAGNIVNQDILGSMEYACAINQTKLIVVLGHTSCGTVKGACDDVKLGNLSSLLKNVKLAVNQITTPESDDRSSKNLNFVNKVALANVQIALDDIKTQSPILWDLYQKGEINIVGAMYNHRTGKVEFFD